MAERAQMLRPRLWLRSVLLLASFVVFGFAVLGVLVPGPSQATATDLPVRPAPAAVPGQPEIVEVGTHLNKVLSIDLATGTYDVDFFIWMSWRGDIDPSTSLDYVNGVGEPDKNQPTFPAPQLQPDGSYYQGWHVQGTYTNTLNFQDFPRDVHEIVIDIQDNTHDASELVYQSTGVTTGPQFSALPDGWKEVGNPRVETTLQQFDTDFGLAANPSASEYSQLSVITSINKPIIGYISRAILPIIVVMLITLVSYFLGPRQTEARMGIGVTTLISAVLLRDAAVAGLPDVPYFVRIDVVFLCSYVVIFAAIAQSVVSLKLAERGKTARAIRVDHIVAAISAVVFFGLLSMALFWHPPG